MAGNSKDIRAFFQAVPKPAPKPKAPLSTAAPSSDLSTLSSPPSSPASRGSIKRARSSTAGLGLPPQKRSCSSIGVDGACHTPSRRPQPNPQPRDAVIADSDDSASSTSSADSLEDVSTMWQRINPAAAAAAAAAAVPARTPVAVTPTKRGRRPTLDSTPLTVRTRRMQQDNQKYGMQALLRLNQADLDAEASGERVSALFRADGGESSPEPEVLEAELDGFEPKDDGKGKVGKQRVRAAIRRVEAQATSRCYYFFEQQQQQQQQDALAVSQRPRGEKAVFPTKFATGFWAFLKSPITRTSYFLSGIPQQLIMRGHALPEELFLWILRQVPAEENKILRQQYINTVADAVAEPRFAHLINEEILTDLMGGLGAKKESISGMLTKLVLGDEIVDPYAKADWSCLVSCLDMIAALASRTEHDNTAPALSLATVTTATQMILRIGLDRAVMENASVSASYKAAIESLADCVAATDWADYCYGASNCLYTSVESANLRWQPLSYMGAETPRLHDFRRRLALVFFFDDLSCARQAPSESTDLWAVIQRAESTLGVRNDTNYEETAALLRLLDVAVDAGFDRSEADFDQQVDELTRVLKSVWSSIIATGGGHSSRLDAKTLAEWIPDRLRYTVRMRRPPRSTIYDTVVEKPAGRDIRTLFPQKLAPVPK